MLTGSNTPGTTAHTAPAPRTAVQLLREEADFRRVYLSQLVSLGGDWFAMIPLLALLQELTSAPCGGRWSSRPTPWSSPRCPRTPE